MLQKQKRTITLAIWIWTSLTKRTAAPTRASTRFSGTSQMTSSTKCSWRAKSGRRAIGCGRYRSARMTATAGGMPAKPSSHAPTTGTVASIGSKARTENGATCARIRPTPANASTAGFHLLLLFVRYYAPLRWQNCSRAWKKQPINFRPKKQANMNLILREFLKTITKWSNTATFASRSLSRRTTTMLRTVRIHETVSQLVSFWAQHWGVF